MIQAAQTALKDLSENDRLFYITFVLAIAALIFTLHIGLLPALLGGLLVYQFAEFGTKVLERAGVLPAIGKILLLVAFSALVIGGLAYAIIACIEFLFEGPESLTVLMQRMADVVATARSHLPMWAHDYLPTNITEWQAATSDWLRDNARELGFFGREVGGFLLHLIFGMIIGGLAALKKGKSESSRAPLTKAIAERASFLENAFSNIVFSQAKISALNTFFTAIFLVVVMPILGFELPLTRAMIAVTFLAGLLPIIGNLISNSVIFLIAMSVSPMAAIISLSYLVVIHKLEYFFNARIIGSHIRSQVWEVLLVMLVMESTFGLQGVVAAPIFYAYLKDELTARKLI